MVALPLRLRFILAVRRRRILPSLVIVISGSLSNGFHGLFQLLCLPTLLFSLLQCMLMIVLRMHFMVLALLLFLEDSHFNHLKKTLYLVLLPLREFSFSLYLWFLSYNYNVLFIYFILFNYNVVTFNYSIFSNYYLCRCC